MTSDIPNQNAAIAGFQTEMEKARFNWLILFLSIAAGGQ